MSRRLPFPPPEDENPPIAVRRLSVSTIQDVVPGGILRAGKRDFGDSYTGWWLGVDDDGVPKLDITFDDDTHIRFDDTGITIGGDGSAITHIDGAAIQTGTITADKLNVGTLSAITATTGALTVSSTLTMGAAGQITWASGGCRITDDYLDMDIGSSDLYALRFLASGACTAYLAARQSDSLTQVSIQATGPAATKSGRIALAAVEWPAGPEDDDPATVGLVIDSAIGIGCAALAYSAGCTFAVSDMDATFGKDMDVGGALAVAGSITAATGTITGGGTGVGLDMGSSQVKTVQTGITEVYIDRYGVLLKNIYTGSGWARTFLRYVDDDDVMYFGIGGSGSGQTCNHAWWGRAYNDTWIKIGVGSGVAQDICINYDGNDYNFRVKSDTRTAALYVDGANGYVGLNTDTPAVTLDIADDSLRIRTAKTPGSAGAGGSAGQICWDSAYLYVCTATNSWKRTAISSW